MSTESTNDCKDEDIDIENITQQAAKTIVLHPGSSHLRLGKACDPRPVMIPHAIAWKHRSSNSCRTIRMKLLRTDVAPNVEHLDKMNEELKANYNINLNWQSISKENRRKKPEKLQEACGWTWTDTSHKPEFLIGDDALYIDEHDNYDLFFPIVNGQLNIEKKSLTAVIADIKALWTKAIETFLGITVTELKDYRCALLIPDLYIHHHIKQLVNLLLQDIGFSAIIVHQESVCVTYGCGISTACVVDVGHHKTSICCVEDGISHKPTRMCLDIGGCDITQMFAWLLHRNSFPYKSCNTEERMDALLIEELKETFCHLDMMRLHPELQEFHLRRPGELSLLYPITLGYELAQAPMVLLFPLVLGRKDNTNLIHFSKPNPGDSEDPFDETYLLSTRTKQEEAWATKRERAAAASTDNPIDVTTDDFDDDISYRDFTENIVPKPSELVGIDQAILWSIENCPNSYEGELKRRMYKAILIVGGGLAYFNGAAKFLKTRLDEKLFQMSKTNVIDKVEVICKAKDQDPSTVAWKGGSVLCCLDGSQELWIKKDVWNQHGLKALREQCPFIW